MIMGGEGPITRAGARARSRGGAGAGGGTRRFDIKCLIFLSLCLDSDAVFADTIGVFSAVYFDLYVIYISPIARTS